MTNWKRFKITGRLTNKHFIKFSLDSNLNYREDVEKHIWCTPSSLFNSWLIGDCLEIDIDRIRYINLGEDINDTIARKVPSTKSVDDMKHEIFQSRTELSELDYITICKMISYFRFLVNYCVI